MIRRSAVLSLVLVSALIMSQQAKANGPFMVDDFGSYYDNGVTVYYGDVVNFIPGQPIQVVFGDLFVATITANANGSFVFEKVHASGTCDTASVVAMQGTETSMPNYTIVCTP